ncbi:unnamed protein product, partial [Symbiodinium sp. KB8]
WPEHRPNDACPGALAGFLRFAASGLMFRLSLACPFGGDGPLPEGHPPLDGRRLSTYPGLEDVNLWFQNTNGEASNFGDMAVKRWTCDVDGLLAGIYASPGWPLAKAMCDNNMSVSTVNGARMQDCALDAVYNQTLMTPTAILIFKFRSSTVDQLKNILHLWRTDKTGQSSHAPQMMSSLVLEKDWGSGGQIISKTVPCSQIPEKFKYQNLGDCEQMGDSGVLLADEAYQVWSSLWVLQVPYFITLLGGLCSITKDNCPGFGDFVFTAHGGGRRPPLRRLLVGDLKTRASIN